MRLRIQLAVLGDATLNFNYQAALSAAIFETLRKVPIRGLRDYSEKDLFEKYKRFVFSKLFDLKFTVEKGKSFMHLQACKPYFFLNVNDCPADGVDILNTFRNEVINLNTLIMPVLDVKVLKDPVIKSGMVLKPLSPIFVRDEREIYPGKPGYEAALMENLIMKYEVTRGVALPDYGSGNLEILTKPKKWLIWKDRLSFAAFEFNFRFDVVPELLNEGIQRGFGSMNGNGCGYCVPAK